MTPYYQDSAVTIYHGDCREILTLDCKSDLVVADPPYGVDLEYTEAVDDSFGNWKELIDETMPLMKENTRGAVLLSTSKLEGEAYLFSRWFPDWRICWFKGACCTRSFVGFKDWETIFVYGKPRGDQFHDYFHASASDVREQVIGHPCPKPDRWARWLIGKCSLIGDSVLDPFMGSGTTLRAAKDLGRKAIGIEIEERYCEIAAKRMEQEVLPFTDASHLRSEVADTASLFQ